MPLIQIEPDVRAGGNRVGAEKLKAEIPRRRAANGDVRLSPVPPRNTLLTVIFFSAVAIAIGYWIFFPPTNPTPAEQTVTPHAQSAPANSSESKNPIRPD